ncbi:MAG TPA: S8 family serine peptidase [Verrucomicrobiae bacterium]
MSTEPGNRPWSLIIWLCLLLVLAPGAGAAETNSLNWQTDRDLVSANMRGETLLPLLNDIAHQTGWHVFVEPNALDHRTSVKFRDLPPGEALHQLLGDLNYAFVPQTNGPQQLYVFTTVMQNATQPVNAAPVKAAAPKHVANELIVKLKHGGNIDAIAKALGAKVIARNDKLGLYRLQFDTAAATDAALGTLKSNSDVATVDYNYVYDPPVTPQPLANVPPGNGPVSLTLDPNTPNDPCNPIVGLIDTGVQPLGGQLDSFLMPAVNVSGDNSTLSSTMPTHGTAMAQTILRAVSQQGGNSSIRILPVNVYGNSEQATTWNIALGVQAAVDGGATVLNMSLAGPSDSPVLSDIIQQALAKGVVVFAAAGNQPVATPNYPAAIPGVNAVTALGAPGQLASYANYGNFVEMALPGDSVIYLGNQAYVVQGTSPATAYASGVAAGARANNCQPWSQIENSMATRFPVPQKK